MSTTTPTSTNDRFHEEGDWIARQFFSPADLALSPEEYVARHAHLLGCFALHRYHFRDPQLAVWVARVGEILSTEGEVERCRKRFLKPEEAEAVRQKEAEEL